MKHTPKRILVPTDFSDASDRALALAKEVAHRFDAEIHLLHVRIVLDDPSVGAEILDEVERILAISEPSTRQALELAGKEDGAIIHAHMERRTIPAEVIVEAVSEYDCDLVVMGTHGQRGFRRLLAGSVAQEVVHRSPVPVLMTLADPGRSFPPHRILAAVDFSDESLDAVERAGHIASALDAEVTLLHVVQPLIYPEFYALDALPAQQRQRIMERCHDSLAEVAKERLQEVPFTTAVIEDHVAVGITMYAKKNNVDLVVLATKGLTGVAHAVLGSVAERVIRLSDVPVLTVRGNS